jgi:hypothetical protein
MLQVSLGLALVQGLDGCARVTTLGQSYKISGYPAKVH